MKGLSEIIDSLEVKFFRVNLKLTSLDKENQELKQKLAKAEEIQLRQIKEITVLKNQIENLKMANSLLGSEENKRETKLKINSIIREIDFCITQLSD